MAQLVQHMILDLKVMSSSPMLDREPTKKKRKVRGMSERQREAADIREGAACVKRAEKRALTPRSSYGED